MIPLDQWNWGVYRLAEEGEKGKRDAPDGRRLVALNKYASTIPFGLEIIRQLALKSKDMSTVADINGALVKIKELNDEFKLVAERIEKAANADAGE